MPAWLQKELLQVFYPGELSDMASLSGGQDNLTYSGTHRAHGSIVIQYMPRVRSDAHRDFLSRVLQRACESEKRHGAVFAENIHGKERFYPVSHGSVHIMQGIPGTAKDVIEYTNSELRELLPRVAQTLARWHIAMDTYDWDIRDQISLHRENYPSYFSQAQQHAPAEAQNIHNMIEQYRQLNETVAYRHDLPKGIIHGDPSLKNVVFSNNHTQIGLIDYDMISYTTRIWELADLFRGTMKHPWCDRALIQDTIAAYEREKPLTSEEKNALPHYTQMMILDTGIRYVLRAIEHGTAATQDNMLKKAQRCLDEYKRTPLLFI